jgi:hypothetical protein
MERLDEYDAEHQQFPKCNSLHIMSNLDWLEKAEIGRADYGSVRHAKGR